MILTKAEIVSRLSFTPPLIENLINAEVQIQPNGVDLSLQSVSKYDGDGTIDFSNQSRVLPPLSTLEFDADGWLVLQRGSYLVTFNEIVNLPIDVMAIGRPRSSMLRVGATVETAVWDAGYRGRSQSMLIVYNENLRLSKNARIMQLVFMRLSKETEAYKGVYQGENL